MTCGTWTGTSMAFDETESRDEPLETAHQAGGDRVDCAEARAARLQARVRALAEAVDARTGCRYVVGESVEWQRVLTRATQVAPTMTTVLLLGESGTGKEVLARFVHRASSRDRGPFVALNCAALPEQLLEAELFGYERGAFTGAAQSKPGLLEQACGGTLFLDEIAEMSPSAQAKLLRVLQEREFQRLGGTRVLRTDARIVAATNRDLARAISAGEFREDCSIDSTSSRSRCQPCAVDARTSFHWPRCSSRRSAAISRGRRPVSRATAGARCSIRVARQRPRAAQQPGARRDSLRRRSDHGRAPAGACRRASAEGVVRSRDDRSR